MTGKGRPSRAHPIRTDYVRKTEVGDGRAIAEERTRARTSKELAERGATIRKMKVEAESYINKDRRGLAHDSSRVDELMRLIDALRSDNASRERRIAKNTEAIARIDIEIALENGHSFKAAS
jgi:hypothetical protein